MYNFVRLKNENDIMELLGKGANINDFDQAGDTLLTNICARGNINLVKFLLKNGANVNKANRYDKKTPLIVACQLGFYDIAKLLLEKGANPNLEDRDTNAPLTYAYDKGDISIVGLLIDNNANVNITLKKGQTLLTKAAKRGDDEILDSLLKREVDINKEDKDGYNAIMYACFRQDKKMIDKLLQKKANINSVNQQKWETPLIIACKKNNQDLVNHLINKGAEVNIKEKDMGSTPLVIACQNNNLDMVKYLVEKGSKINEYGMLKKVALIEALKVGNNKIGEFLMEHGANLNMVDGDGITPLKCACNMNNFRLAKHIMKSLSNDTTTRIQKLKSLVDDKQADEILKDKNNKVLRDIKEEKRIREKEEILELLFRSKRAMYRTL